MWKFFYEVGKDKDSSTVMAVSEVSKPAIQKSSSTAISTALLEDKISGYGYHSESGLSASSDEKSYTDDETDELFCITSGFKMSLVATNQSIRAK